MAVESASLALLQSPAALAAKGKPENPAARKAAAEFESVFVNQLLESMSQGLKSDGDFTGGEAEGTYRSLLNDAFAKEISRRGGVGIAEQVYQEILKMQEGQAPVVAAAAASGAYRP